MSAADKKKKKGFGLFKGKNKAAPMEIGTPYNYQQHIHVGFDSQTGQFKVTNYF